MSSSVERARSTISSFAEKLLPEPLTPSQELVMDVGTVLDGDEAVAEGLIDTLGSLHDAMDCLDKMIATEKNKQRAKPRKGKKSL